MNRVLGDYFETLMYKIFVSIDEHTNIAEVSLRFFTLLFFESHANECIMVCTAFSSPSLVYIVVHCWSRKFKQSQCFG